MCTSWAGQLHSVPTQGHSRFPGRSLRLAAHMAVVTFVVSSIGCTIRSTPKSTVKPAKLGDAVEEAKKDPQDQDVVQPEKTRRKDDPAGQRYPDGDDDEHDAGYAGVAASAAAIDHSLDSDADETPAVEPKESGRLHGGIIVGGGNIGGDEFDGYTAFGIQIGEMFPRFRTRLDLAGRIHLPNLTDQSGLAGGIKNEWEIAVEGSGRYYLTPTHTLMGLYLIGGARLGQLFWDFGSPIEVEDADGIRTVYNDNLGYFTPFAGFGVSIIQKRSVHVGAHLTGGYRIYGSSTGENLENNVFKDESLVELMVEVTVGRHR